jgi:hypothetical protein
MLLRVRTLTKSMLSLVVRLTCQWHVVRVPHSIDTHPTLEDIQLPERCAGVYMRDET